MKFKIEVPVKNFPLSKGQWCCWHVDPCVDSSVTAYNYNYTNYHWSLTQINAIGGCKEELHIA